MGVSCKILLGGSARRRPLIVPELEIILPAKIRPVPVSTTLSDRSRTPADMVGSHWDKEEFHPTI